MRNVRNRPNAPGWFPKMCTAYLTTSSLCILLLNFLLSLRMYGSSSIAPWISASERGMGEDSRRKEWKDGGIRAGERPDFWDQSAGH